jgi:hypothetical protein
VYTFIMVNGKRIVARMLEHDMAYQRTNEISSDEKTRYYTNVVLPDGATGATYREKVFGKAVEEVTKKLKVLLDAIDTDAYDAFQASLKDWNLDKGTVDEQHPDFALWNGHTEWPFNCAGDPPLEVRE